MFRVPKTQIMSPQFPLHQPFCFTPMFYYRPHNRRNFQRPTARGLFVCLHTHRSLRSLCFNRDERRDWNVVVENHDNSSPLKACPFSSTRVMRYFFPSRTQISPTLNRVSAGTDDSACSATV